MTEPTLKKQKMSNGQVLKLTLPCWPARSALGREFTIHSHHGKEHQTNLTGVKSVKVREDRTY